MARCRWLVPLIVAVLAGASCGEGPVAPMGLEPSLNVVPVVCTGDETLTTQADIDGFDCTEVTGNLFIYGPDVTNLDGLSALTSVGGDVTISDNAALADLDGLSGLTSVGALLVISGNDALTRLGLPKLMSVGYILYIADNDALTSCAELSRLLSRGEVGGPVTIEANGGGSCNAGPRNPGRP